MKKLTNVSPFLLLLFPVLVMMLLGFATHNESLPKEVIASKGSSNPATILIKAAQTIIK